jgi:4-cresol dehydrogenase (hydroxylating)
MSNDCALVERFDKFFEKLLDKAAVQRVPQLFANQCSEALYRIENRGGVSVVALRTASLTEGLLIEIMRYRLAQYVALRYVNLEAVYRSGADYESLDNVSSDDVHVVSGVADTGEILCYMVIRTGPSCPDGTTLRSRERPLFPVERIFGRGLYNPLRVLPDLPVIRIRELERFVRNQQRQGLDHLMARAPVETFLAVFQVLTGPMAGQVDACIGDWEENVAKKHSDFFHIPTVVLHGVLPYVSASEYPHPSYDQQTRYPFALLRADIRTERLCAIDRALSLPGRRAMSELARLKADTEIPRSSLGTPGGLADAPVRQEGVLMMTRRHVLDTAEWLRTTRLFGELSTAQAAALTTLLERQSVSPGDVIVRQGDPGGELYLIEAGCTDVVVRGTSPTGHTIATLGPGDCFGETTLISSGSSGQPADVVAREPTILLKLTKDAYVTYVANSADIEPRLMRIALSRMQEVARCAADADGLVALMRKRFSEQLPEHAIVTERSTIEHAYGRNVTALHRRVPVVLRPRTERDVHGIMSVANKWNYSLYPFSTGRNWGLGSKLPVVDGCVLVDLAGMNRVIEVNDEFAYAIIEPGVTQGDLAAHLARHHSSLTFNFTGSFAYTSIVGNVLERGDGAYARVHDLLGVRGILGNGRPFQAGGLWSYIGGPHPSHHTRYTAGPDLTGLFSQSNFGIVTQMAFRLIHKPERRYILWGAVPDAELARLVDALGHFSRQGVINPGSLNIGYANRFVQAREALTPKRVGAACPHEGWNFYVLVSGTARVADAVMEDLESTVRPLTSMVGSRDVGTIRDPTTDLPEFLRPLAMPLLGAPDAETIKQIYRMTGTAIPDDPREIDVDHTPFGMKCYVGLVPPSGRYARRAADVVAALRDEFALNVKVSFFGDGRSLVTIHFRADDRMQVERAARCEATMWNRMVSAGFPPYRASIDQMERLVDLQPETFELVGQLKSVLDPHSIIAPGRYSRV